MSPTPSYDSTAASKQKAQAAVELLVVLAIGIVVVGFVIYYSQEQFATSYGTYYVQQAKSALNDIAKAADEVYAEGAGARKQLLVTIPEGTTSTSIANRMINIRMQTAQGPTDVNARTNEEIYGELPSAPGTYTTWVIAEENRVRIGLRALNIDPSFLYVQTDKSNATQLLQRTVTVRNSGSSNLSVSLAINWTHSDVTVVFNDPSNASFELEAGASKNVVLDITVNANVTGTYSGRLNGIGDSETAWSDITVEVRVCPACLPVLVPRNVAYLNIETFKDSLYDTRKYIFDPTSAGEPVLIYGGNWDANSTVTLDLRNPSNVSVAGYPKNVLTNGTGWFTDAWDPSGQAIGTYTVYANDSTRTRQRSFALQGCG